jgi:hypothetical protein
MTVSPPLKLNGFDSWRREAMRVVLAMSTAAGTVYTSVRSALSDHETRIGVLEQQQQKVVPRPEIEAHWDAISKQLDRIEQDLRDLRYGRTDLSDR